jgi:hypothetical protein
MIAMRRDSERGSSWETFLMVFWPFREVAAAQPRPAPISSAFDEPEESGESD